MTSDTTAWPRWQSTDYAAGEQFDAWRAALDDSHLPWALTGGRSDRFDASMRRQDFGDLRVVTCRCEPCAGRRRARQRTGGEGEYVAALLLLAGEEHVRQQDRALVLQPRSLLVWDSTQDIDFEVAAGISKVTVFVPRDRVAARASSFLRHRGEVVDCRRGMPAVTAAHLAALADELGTIDELDGTAALDLTVELIAATLEAGEDLSLTRPQRDLLAGIERYVLANLADPELTPETIARHFYISTRYLHRLFAHTPWTAGRYIVEHRLDLARRELLRTAGSGESISQVAGRLGFVDSAHFSRLFRQRFGLAPRELRRARLGR